VSAKTKKDKEKKVVFEPIGDRCVVKRDDSEEMTPGGIVLAQSAQEKARFGTVVAVGPGCPLESGARMEMQVKEGDRVILGLYTETADIAGDEFVLVSERDIQAIVREE
jgi:chaperonin GroES